MEPEILENRIHARHLRVKVIQGSTTKVELTMPARSALWMETLLPTQVLKQLVNHPSWQAWTAIKRTEEDLVPREIFFHQTEDKSYRVWLE